MTKSKGQVPAYQLPMKLFLVILSTTLFLTACSGTADTVSDRTSESVEEVEAAEATNPEPANTEDEENSDEGEKDDEKSDTEDVEQKNVELVVKNQETVGQIVVEKIATARDGWVSVHRSQEGGGIQLPDSIGEARVDSGDSEEIIVDLWESPEIGEKLWVLLHVDSGERGKYEFPEKDAAVTKDGETMARSFVVEGEEEENEDEDE